MKLRNFFEVDSSFVVLAVLTELNKLAIIDDKTLTTYFKKAEIDENKINPLDQ